MGKAYKGYELYRMIANGEIKRNSQFKDNNNQIWNWNGFDFISEYDYNDYVFSLMDFEILEDEETDIEEIEEITETSTIDYSQNTKEMITAYQLIHKCEDKINKLTQAVKQLDNKMKEK